MLAPASVANHPQVAAVRRVLESGAEEGGLHILPEGGALHDPQHPRAAQTDAGSSVAPTGEVGGLGGPGVPPVAPLGVEELAFELDGFESGLEQLRVPGALVQTGQSVGDTGRSVGETGHVGQVLDRDPGPG